MAFQQSIVEAINQLKKCWRNKMNSSFTLEQYYNSFETEETIKKFFDQTKPSDYYFQARDDGEGSHIRIVAKVFFNENNCCDDQTPKIDHLLPKDFFKIKNSTWECKRRIKEINKDLIKRGFARNNILE